MRVASFGLFVSLLSFTTIAGGSRPLPIHHRESSYVGDAYWGASATTRSYRGTVVSAFTLRGIEIYADIGAGESCVARVYRGNTLRAEGAVVTGSGAGQGDNLGWVLLPIDTEVFAAEVIDFAVYCTSTTTTTHYPHRDAPTVQLDVPGYVTNVTSRSVMADGAPTGADTWWGDWRLRIESHGAHSEYSVAAPQSTAFDSASGVSFTPTRRWSATGLRAFMNVASGTTCTPHVFDASGMLVASGSAIAGDVNGMHWHRSHFAKAFFQGEAYTTSIYCDGTASFLAHENDPTIYELDGDAVAAIGMTDGGDGTVPALTATTTPVMAFQEGAIELTDRDGSLVDGPSAWDDRTWGWRFTPEVPLTVRGVEVLLQRSGGTAVARVYETDSGNLIASSDVSMPTSSEQEWRVAPLPETPLQAGTRYTVAVYYSGSAGSSGYYIALTDSAHSFPGVLTDIQFCGSVAAEDQMPTDCSYPNRLERLLLTLCDDDEDGYQDLACGGDDCDDGDPEIHPGATEIPADGVDSDCDTQEQCYADADGDGYGGFTTALSSELTCIAAGVAPTDADCDDGDAEENPAATWYADADEDGYGDTASSNACERAAATDVTNDEDCDDGDDTETPDVLWYADADGDGFGDATSIHACERADATDVTNADDCDDTEDGVFPGSEEPVPGIDHDCDGEITQGPVVDEREDPDPETDGGAPPASLDAGAPTVPTPSTDSGAPPAVVVDGDAGAPPPMGVAGAPMDAGARPGGGRGGADGMGVDTGLEGVDVDGDGGCGCRTASRKSSSAPWWGAALVLVVLGRLRRRA